MKLNHAKRLHKEQGIDVGFAGDLEGVPRSSNTSLSSLAERMSNGTNGQHSGLKSKSISEPNLAKLADALAQRGDGLQRGNSQNGWNSADRAMLQEVGLMLDNVESLDNSLHGSVSSFIVGKKG